MGKSQIHHLRKDGIVTQSPMPCFAPPILLPRQLTMDHLGVFARPDALGGGG